MPLSASSLPTCGPTKSLRTTVPGLSAVDTAWVICLAAWALAATLFSASSTPSSCMRTSRSLPDPNEITWASPKPASAKRARASLISTGLSKRSSVTVPPVKSSAKLKPLVVMAPIETAISSAPSTNAPHFMRRKLIRGSAGKMVRGFMFVFPSDRDGLELLATAVDQRRHCPRRGYRGVHRGDDADDQRDREAFDRPGAEREPRDAGEDRGQVGIHDRAGGLFITDRDR